MPAARKDFEDQETCADLRGDHLSQVEIMVGNHIQPNPTQPFYQYPIILTLRTRPWK